MRRLRLSDHIPGSSYDHPLGAQSWVMMGKPEEACLAQCDMSALGICAISRTDSSAFVAVEC